MVLPHRADQLQFLVQQRVGLPSLFLMLNSIFSRYIATGSLDTNVMVWDLQQSGEHPLVIRGAHSMSAINGVAWLSDNRLLTVGQDSNLKLWALKL